MFDWRMCPALPVAVALTVGIFLGYFTSFVPLWLSLSLACLFMGLGFIVLKFPRLRFIPVVVALIMVGWGSMTFARSKTFQELPEGKTTVEGTIVDTPRPTVSGTQQTIYATMYVQRGALAGKKIRCYMPKDASDIPHIGGTYTLKGKLRAIKNFNNSNFLRWAQCHGIVATIRVYEGNASEMAPLVEDLPFRERISLKAKLLRERLLGLLAKENIPRESLALISSIAFGERSALSHETQNTFAQLGIAHLLAISGFHLSIIYTLLSMLFFRYKSRAICSAVVVVAIWFYALFVGMPTSIVRAAMMFTIYTLFAPNTKARLSANTLFVTISIMLLINPLMIWDVSFQLSVLAVLAISIFYRPIYQLINGKWLSRHPLMRRIWALLVVSFSAQVGVFPLVLCYFGYFSPIFLLANLVAVPLTTGLLLFVFVALALWWIPIVRSLMIGLASLSAEGLMWSANNILTSLFLLFALFATFTTLYLTSRKNLGI